MSEETWTSETPDDRPTPKKGLPKWLWFLGCGCMTMVALVALGGFFLYRAFEGMQDPAVQWPALAKVLPYDEPHPELRIIGMKVMSLTPGIDDMWTLFEEDGSATAVVYVLSGKEGLEARTQLLSTGQEVNLPLLGGVMQNVVGARVPVQGRELEAVRFTQFGKQDDEDQADEAQDEDEDKDGFFNEVKRAAKKAAIRIDVTPEGDEGRYVLIEYAKVGTLDPVTDEEIQQFLAPFHIGPDR